MNNPRFWRTALLASGVALLLLLGLAFAAVHWVGDLPVHVMVNGNDVFGAVQFESLLPMQKLALVFGLAVALLVMLLVSVLLVPLLVLLVVLCVALPLVLAFAVGFGIPLLVLLGLAALLLGPPLLIGWLLWRLLRRTAPTPTTMPA